MNTGNEPARSAEKQDELGRDHQELGRNPLEKTDTTEAPAEGAGSEPPD
ncbi:hypothetical protein HC028_10125 [Planosporangium flavigriseum]|uniref:Uncharacterized protein n=1 Tax=Planosporangium flavigriseum TaxID=373681 RepID=A0A8J3LG50_9ACTN|nr:hypothetical protein [Planosporangium flavigriseum]NJC64856.1 hypothetical protein [Planosporangium flavigriseum]GIG72728.1 hypothetical protein Pfl04_11320 [Planosporangium flavigriseum]